MPTNRTRIHRLAVAPEDPVALEFFGADEGEDRPPPPRPPKHLSREAKDWWKRLTANYDLSPESAQLLLTTALEAYMRMRDAQAAIARDGLIFTDQNNGNLRNHPATTVERDSRNQLMQGMRALNLAHEVEPIKKPGRPTGT